MKKFENIRQIINYEFPQFDIGSIKKLGEGDNYKAFLINQQYVFRFPKSEEAKQLLIKEMALLPRISPQLNLKVPDLSFISGKINFAGHKLIAGKFLSDRIYHSLDKTFRTAIQKSLAAFLSQLHLADLSSLKDCGLQTMDPRGEYSDDFAQIQKLIFPNIPAPKRKIITAVFSSYLANQNNFNYTPSLIHNDFSTDHILINISEKKVSGIIDFGDSAIGDPDYDLMYLFDYFGVSFITEFPGFDNPRYQKALMEKLFFFAGANKLQIVLLAIKNNDRHAVKVGYQNLEKWFRKLPEAK